MTTFEASIIFRDSWTHIQNTIIKFYQVTSLSKSLTHSVPIVHHNIPWWFIVLYLPWFKRELTLLPTRPDSSPLQKTESGDNPTKLFFFVNKEIFRFLFLSLAIVCSTHIFFICYKLSSLTAKIRKPEKWKFGRTESAHL